VIGVIGPWNYPILTPVGSMAYALAAGNAVVFKPSEYTPALASFYVERFREVVPEHPVLQVIYGAGDTGAHLVRSGVDKVAFTGSTATGRHVARVAGEALKPVTMELGGNAAHLVFEDADLETAVAAIIKAFVFNTGQFCMGGPRLLVARPVHDTLLGILADAVPGVPVGDPRRPETVVGPMAGERHLKKVEEYVALARKEGGRIVCGGERLDLDGGYYYRPTVVAGLSNDSRVVQEEIFGPVLTVQPFDTEDEAVALANSTPYGLASGIQTQNLARAHRVAGRLQAGIVWINDWALLDPAVPFGGVKDSGFGREYGPEALDAYTKVKSVVVSLG
jgi:acyl-CoA reductase-like NAD-dependent aldehyde dehydrogenase